MYCNQLSLQTSSSYSRENPGFHQRKGGVRGPVIQNHDLSYRIAFGSSQLSSLHSRDDPPSWIAAGRSGPVQSTPLRSSHDPIVIRCNRDVPCWARLDHTLDHWIDPDCRPTIHRIWCRAKSHEPLQVTYGHWWTTLGSRYQLRPDTTSNRVFQWLVQKYLQVVSDKPWILGLLYSYQHCISPGLCIEDPPGLGSPALQDPADTAPRRTTDPLRLQDPPGVPISSYRTRWSWKQLPLTRPILHIVEQQPPYQMVLKAIPLTRPNLHFTSRYRWRKNYVTLKSSIK